MRWAQHTKTYTKLMAVIRFCALDAMRGVLCALRIGVESTTDAFAAIEKADKGRQPP